MTPDFFYRFLLLTIISAVSLLSAFAQPPATAEDWLKLGNKNLTEKKYDDAVKAFSECIRVQPKADGCYRSRGYTYFLMKDYEKATPDVTKSIELNPKDIFSYGLRGDINLRLGKYQLAVADYSSAIGIDPKDIYYGARGGVYENLKNYDAALADFTKSISLNPANGKWFDKRGDIYRSLKKFDLAIVDYTKAIELNPQSAYAYVERGLAYYRNDKFQDAVNDYTKAIALDAKYIWGYVNRGVVNEKIGKYDAAVADFSKAIELDPKSETFLRNRGYTYFLLKKYDLAMSDLKKAIELNPKYAWAYNNLGNIFYAQEKYSDAAANFTKAVEFEDKYSAAYFNRGLANFKLQNNESALSDFSKAIEILPDYVEALIQRGRINASIGKHDLALADFNKLIELQPNEGMHYVDRSYSYTKQNRNIESIADATKAISLDPKLSLAFNNRGGSYTAIGKFTEAVADLTKAIELNPELSNSYFGRSQAYCKQGLKDLASRDEKKAIELGFKVTSPCSLSAGNYAVVDAGSYANYKDAMTAGAKLFTAKSYLAAATVYEKAFTLAITDTERADALLASNNASEKIEVGQQKTRNATLEAERNHKERQETIRKKYEQVTELKSASDAQRLAANRALIKYYTDNKNISLKVVHSEKLLEFKDVPADEKLLLISYIADNSLNPATRTKYYEIQLNDKKTSNAKKAEIYSKLAGVHKSLKLDKKVIEVHDKTIALTGIEPRYYAASYAELAKADFTAKKYADALKKAETINGYKDFESKSKGKSLIWFAEEFFKAKEFESAKKVYEIILSLPELDETFSTNANFAMGNIYFTEKNYAKSHEYYEKIPGTYDARKNNVHAYYLEKNYKEAAALTVSTLQLLGQKYYAAATQTEKQETFTITNQFLQQSLALANELSKLPETIPEALSIYKEMYKLIPAQSADGKSLDQKIKEIEAKQAN